MICPKCEWEQADTNEECQKCGVIFSKILPPSSYERPPSKGWSIFAGGPRILLEKMLVVGIFGIVLYALTASSWESVRQYGARTATQATPNAYVDWRSKDASLQALLMMQDFVKDQLKAPSTADFKPGYKDSVIHLDGQRYRIVSWVDSQNSFGAKLRNHFRGEIEQTKKGYWELKSLEFVNP